MSKKFDFDDISIIPEIISDIYSRRHIDILIDDTLPLMNAPMYDVINEDNYINFLNNDILTITARNHNVDNSETFSSYSLDDFEKEFITTKKSKDFKYKILIDIANGHMRKLYDNIRSSKEYYGDNLILMVGNIANPKTYKILSKAGADYIRIGIGAGQSCLTAENTGIFYPMASLIHESYSIKKDLETKGLYAAKIVADGGFKSYSDIIKGLCLGSDYIMLGSILSKSLESAGKKYLWRVIEIKNKKLQKYFLKKGWLYVKYRGMSSKSIQKEMNKKIIKTSEGATRYLKVEYTLDGWLTNFKHYLSSAMSYTNSKNLKEFKETEFVFITDKAFKRFNK